MKKIKFFSFASAVLLASAAGMTSCSSDSIEPTSGSGVAGQVVKTQFVINIPYAGNESGGNARVSTRMTAENTQNNNNFLGLKDIEMFAFDKVPGETSQTSTRTIRIRTDMPSTSNDYRRIYSDIAIPVGTTNMILYAKATRTKTVASGTANKTNFEAGSLTNPYGNFTDEAKPNLKDLNFNLEAIRKNADLDTYGQEILQKLNDIANTTAGGKKWSETGTDESADKDDKILHSLYIQFRKLTAGSTKSVNSFIEHLKEAIESQGVKTDMAEAIKNKCTSVSGTFPRNLDLPDGVAKVKFDPTNGFTFESVTAGTTSTGSNLIDYKTVTYPSELAYFVSSPIKTSTTNKSKVSELPPYNEWLAGTANIWNGYDEMVKNNTLFVALQNPVQYGVACLKSSIKCASTSLIDNASKIVGSESDNTITVNDNSFPVTGILIGGQPAGVKWDFEPASTIQPGDFKYTIYDNNMNGGSTFTAKAIEKSTLPYNYTLVLDNKDTSGGATQSNVNVVIELENNAADFYGADGLIPKGSKFYLAGTLDLTATSGVQKPGNSTVDHVFVKDHTTVANFTITDLKKAYNCIPDMRTSKINVGLAVDLSWKSGITFDVEL
ncbi:hypothetical protein RJT11_02125 [Segatella copri]|uniref:hypothetical protein n=1 Tax=Segatella copri TaxID=165179 RepID=UPI00294B6E2F|nr:hypothetical protein [Segatella copri]WOG04348.1 hypothetical protein RJT11_02125 [Segatella copri]